MRRLPLPEPGPMRLLALTSLVNAAGTSLLVTSLVLYFTRVVGLSGGHVALGLTLGGGLGLLVGVPLGHLADTRGAKGVLLVLLTLLAAATAAYVVVQSFTAFVLVACVAGMLDRGAAAVRSGIVVRSLPAEGLVRNRAYLRAMTNVGFAAGSALATVGIAVGTAAGYRALFALDAVSYLAVAALLVRLPHLPRVPAAAGGPRLVVLRDRPYLAVVGLTALLGIHNAMLDVGLPLWISSHTAAPAALVGIIFVQNCVLVALFSVRFAAGSESAPDAARTARRAGSTILAACLLMALSSSVGVVGAVALLVVAMALQAAGEMFQAASQWGLSASLAPAERQGQYQGAAATGLSAAGSAGPLAMAGVVALGGPGWLLFGALTLGVGAATVPVTRWALSAER